MQPCVFYSKHNVEYLMHNEVFDFPINVSDFHNHVWYPFEICIHKSAEYMMHNMKVESRPPGKGVVLSHFF